MADKKKSTGKAKDGTNRGGARPKVRDDDRRGAPPGHHGNPAYEPNEADRKLCELYGAVLDLEQLAIKIGVSETTLYRYYRKEIESSWVNMIAQCGIKLYQRALKGEGDTSALKAILHARGGPQWSPKSMHGVQPLRPPSSPPDEMADEAVLAALEELSDEEFEIYERLCNRVAIAGPDAGAPGPDGHREAAA